MLPVILLAIFSSLAAAYGLLVEPSRRRRLHQSLHSKGHLAVVKLSFSNACAAI